MKPTHIFNYKTKTLRNSLGIHIALITLFVLQGIAGAVTWQDDFNQMLEDSWYQQGNDSIWSIEEGYLRGKIQTQKQWQTIFQIYQFKAIPGPYNNITINIENIGGTDVRFGIALGKHFLNDDEEVEEIGYYLFFTNDMQASRNGKLFLGPGKRWHTDALNHMLLQFDDGRFQLFGDGESRLDFMDANIKQLDIIGFVLVGYVTNDTSTGSGWAEKITITGLPVTPIRKVTTIWGQLKQEQI